MNVVLVTTNLSGGAGGAARRLHLGLRSAGVTTSVVTRERAGVPGLVTVQGGPRSPHARARRVLDRLPKLLYPSRERMRSFDPQRVPDRIPSRVGRLSPDLVNLHWTCTAFLDVRSVSRFRVPLVWSVHDMWAFTGGCFYSEDCERYTHSCGACPILRSGRERDLSRRVWRRKERAWKDVDLTVVAPSSWLAKCARASSLFRDRRVERIPYGIDLATFDRVDPQRARAALGLPPDRRLLLFGAWGDPRRKGLDLLRAAASRLAAGTRGTDVELVTFGGAGEVTVPGLRSRHLGHVEGDTTLAQLYSAVDVTVVPSTWEALGYVALESNACGTPVVAFDAATGLPDIVDHQENGYLARAFDPDDLARGVEWVLEDRRRHDRLSHHARAKAVNEFSIDRQIHSYLSLFEEILGQERSTSRR